MRTNPITGWKSIFPIGMFMLLDAVSVMVKMMCADMSRGLSEQDQRVESERECEYAAVLS